MEELETIDDFPYSKDIKYDLGRVAIRHIKELEKSPGNEKVIKWIGYFFKINKDRTMRD